MLTLAKGGKLNLSKELGLDKITVQVSWTKKQFDTQKDFDVDVSAFVLQEDGTPFGKLLTLDPNKDGWISYYNQHVVGDNAIVHQGDLRQGGIEKIDMQFSKLPAAASRVAVIVTMHEAAENGQNFGQISDAWCKIMNGSKCEVEFDLDENASTATAVMFCVFKKNPANEWVLQNVCEGFTKGLGDFFSAFKAPGY